MTTQVAPLPFPVPTFWREITAAQWGTFTLANSVILEQHLAFSDNDFQSEISKLQPFLETYFTVHSNALSVPDSAGLLPPSTPDDFRLRRAAVATVYRILVELETPPEFALSGEFLARICLCLLKTRILEAILDSVWTKRRDALEASLSQLVASVIKPLQKESHDKAVPILALITALVVSSTEAGKVVLSGPDFLGSLILAFPNSNAELRYLSLLVVHKGLLALIAPPSRQFSLLADQLYLFKSKTPLEDEDRRRESLLICLISETSLVEDLDLTDAKAGRARRIIGELLPHRVEKKKVPTPTSVESEELSEEMQLNIYQLQDLFPDYGPGFFFRLLKSYSGSVEQATSALLDGNLPPHIDELDRSLTLEASRLMATELADDPLPHPAKVAGSAGISNLQNLYGLPGEGSSKNPRIIGKTHRKDETLDDLLSGDGVANQKAFKSSILSRLAQLAEDDERDDTYDQTDYGATRPSGEADLPEAAGDDGKDGSSSDLRPSSPVPRPRSQTDKPVEIVLYQVWKSNPEIFARTRDARNGKARQGLRARTNWSNDKLEDWALLIARNTAKQLRLDIAMNDPARFGGQQKTTIERTAWRKGDVEMSDDDDGGRGGGRPSDAPPARGAGRESQGNKPGHSGTPHQGGSSGRGGGRGGSRGGSSSGHRGGGRANHNRRDAHAKKMARGG